MAVKIMFKDGGPQRKFLKSELKIIKTVRHQNIIKFHKSIETSKHIYILMDVAEQGDLLQLIQKERGVDEERACRWFHQLVDGVEYCHKNGIAHRDLKCENLLLNKNFVLKITDFGLAKGDLLIWPWDQSDFSKIQCFTFCGDHAYASLEILAGKHYQPYLSDIWSMAVILYVMLYARFPFDTSDTKKYITKVTAELRFPDDPKISSSCKDLIKNILQPESKRIYIPHIKKNQWYGNMYNKRWEEEVQKMRRLSEDSEKSKIPVTKKTSLTQV
ncbi:testis-specific serine/threonine-protein kinase 4-like [Centruroides vittatus]|uniref:testis-specific serine/threonine-protein kinase 4-like n=1 Tax=Centruroides vittatus TaxID=120091 RepID=UPI00350EFAAD